MGKDELTRRYMMQDMTLAVELRRHCSPTGETLVDFTKQFRALTDKDKAEFSELFHAIGVNSVEAKK